MSILDTQEREAASAWLTVELNRIWLMAEASLRALQHSQLRPKAPHASVIELEPIFTARREVRLGSGAAQEDEAALTKVIAAVEKEFGVTLDRDSLSSAIIKQVHKEKRFVRVAPNTFGLRQT